MSSNSYPFAFSKERHGVDHLIFRLADTACAGFDAALSYLPDLIVGGGFFLFVFMGLPILLSAMTGCNAR